MKKLVPASWRGPLEELRDRVTGIFDKWMPGGSEPAPTKSLQRLPSSVLTGAMPAIDVGETDDEVLIYAELPGLDRSDFKVELDDKGVVLRGEKRTSRNEKRHDYTLMESSYGSFYRRIPLPCEVKADKVKAKYKGGVLKIRLPKTDEAKTRGVRVKIT